MGDDILQYRGHAFQPWIASKPARIRAQHTVDRLGGQTTDGRDRLWLIRAQGTYVSDNEVNRIIDHFGDQAPQYSAELAQVAAKSASADGSGGGGAREKDDMYEPAVEIIIREGRGSVSLLQRHLGIGYGRAARLIDYMCEDGIVGPYNGAQAREVLISPADWAARLGQKDEEPEPTRRRRLIIKPGAEAAVPVTKRRRRHEEEEDSVGHERDAEGAFAERNGDVRDDDEQASEDEFANLVDQEDE